MKISPVVKKKLLYGYFLFFIIIILLVSVLAYKTSPVPILDFIIVSLIFEAILTALFAATYMTCIRDFKEFESKIANVDTIVKAIEYSRVIDVITPTNNPRQRIDKIIFDSGIEIFIAIESVDGSELSISDYELSIADVQIPKYSYLSYIIGKKNNEYHERLKAEEANKRTETIINKMKKSWED